MIQNSQYRAIPTGLQLNGPILSFTKTPSDVTLGVGQTAYFTGIATAQFPDQTPVNPAVGFATGTISYRWYEVTEGALSDGVKYTGTATTELFVNDIASPGDNGKQYYLGADYVAIGTSPNANNELFTSSRATLSIYPEIIITKQPSDITVGVGAQATFTVEASLTDGTYGGLNYQWKIDGINVSDGTYESISLSELRGGVSFIEDSAILLLPLNESNGGVNLTDYSVTSNSSFNKTVTPGSLYGSGPTWDSSGGTGNFYNGAAYFNGSTSYLNVAAADFNFAQAIDFTIEAWIKWSNNSWSGTWEVISCLGGGYYADGGSWFAIHRDDSSGKSTNFYIAHTSGYQTIATGIDIRADDDEWQHVALTRQQNTLRLFINGKQVGSLTNTLPYGGINLGYIGLEHAGFHNIGYYYPNFWLQDFKVYKGVAKYTLDFIPSTTSILAYTVNRTDFNATYPSTLAVPFWDKDGSGIADYTDYSTNKKTLTLSGNNGWERTISKWYTGSVYFSGSDYYAITPTTDFAFGTGDFTVESWVYFTESGWKDIFSTGTYNQGQLSIRKNDTSQLASSPGSNQLEVYYNTTIVASGGVLEINAWHHVAVSRQSGTVRLFINGNQVASGTLTDSISADAPRIGSTKGNQYGMKGYIQDFVVYNNIAKYTDSFLVPSSSILSGNKTFTSVSGAQTNSLTITPSNSGSNTIECVVSNPNTQSKTSDQVKLVTTDARSIIKLEGYGTTSTATILEKNIDETEFTLTSSDLNFDDICLYASEKDIDVEIDMYGGSGYSASSFSGGEGGYSRIRFTMKKEEEYVLRGIKSNSALFLYRKGSLIAVVGQGGAGGIYGSGGKGGGVNLAGQNGQDGFRGRGGIGGSRIEIGELGENGRFGSRSGIDIANVYPEDLKEISTDPSIYENYEGQTIKCSKGVYWKNQGLSPCQDIGTSKFRLSDGTEVTNSASITRGFKSGYVINSTGAASGRGNESNGGHGAVGGSASATGFGGGGGSGYSDGSVTISATQLGGNTGAARISMRLSTGDFYVDSFGRILILSNTDGRDPRTLTKTTSKVLPGTNTCIDDARWQRFLDLARNGSQDYRLTATLDGSTTKITNATDKNIYKMLNANALTLRNSLTGWVDSGYAYQLLALAWDETSNDGMSGYGSDYSILSWSPTSRYGFGYYGSSSKPFFQGSTYNHFSANYWILPPGVPDFP